MADTPSFSWLGWNVTSPRAVAAIRSKYSGKAQLQNPNLTEDTSGREPVATEETSAPATPATVANPNISIAERAAQNWQEMGGSPATMHRAQVAEGIRPPIDARGTAPKTPSASDQIQSAWGWPSHTTGNAGTQIWNEMTGRFNASQAAVQNAQERASRLAAAKDELSKTFGPAIPFTPARPKNPAVPPGVMQDEQFGGGNS